MKTSELREKSVSELNEQVLALLQEQFNLRMQKATGQLAKPHRLKEIRREIARIKTLVREIEAAGK